MTTALIIPCYNRPSELSDCFNSLLASDIDLLDHIFIRDDASQHPETIEIIHRFSRLASDKLGVPVNVEMSRMNEGVKRSLLSLYNAAFETFKCDLVINLDSDAIVKGNFISELVRLKSAHPDRIISGFNCDHPRNKIVKDHPDHVERRHANGINLLIDKVQYKNIVHPALLSHSNWDFNCTHYKTFIIAKPSLIQHIAPHNSTLGHVAGDVACDF